MKQFKQSQKIRVIISGVGFYTTVKEIRNSMFCFGTQNAAVQKAICALEGMRSGIGAADKSAIGLCGTWEGLQVQVDLV